MAHYDGHRESWDRSKTTADRADAPAAREGAPSPVDFGTDRVNALRRVYNEARAAYWRQEDGTPGTIDAAHQAGLQAIADDLAHPAPAPAPPAPEVEAMAEAPFFASAWTDHTCVWADLVKDRTTPTQGIVRHFREMAGRVLARLAATKDPSEPPIGTVSDAQRGESSASPARKGLGGAVRAYLAVIGDAPGIEHSTYFAGLEAYKARVSAARLTLRAALAAEREARVEEVERDAARWQAEVDAKSADYARLGDAYNALSEALTAAEADAARLRAVLAPVITYAERHPHLDGAEGEIGAFYGPAFRHSISYAALRAVRDYAREGGGPADCRAAPNSGSNSVVPGGRVTTGEPDHG